MPPRKSTARGPRPRRAARPSAAALSVTGGTASSSSSSLRTELSEPAIPASSSGSTLEISSATIGELQDPIEPSSHVRDERIENESCIEERKLADEDKFENELNCNAAVGALQGSGRGEVDKSLAEEATSSVGSALAAHAEENGQKTGGFVGAEAHIEDSSRDIAMKFSEDGNNQNNELRDGRENAGEVPRKRIVKRIVKVVRIVKRKVPKKVRKSDPDTECSNQETEAKLITNHCNMIEKEEQAESIAAIPMEVDYLRKDETSVIEGEGSLKRSDQDDSKLSKDSGDKLWKMQSCANVLEKPLILDALVDTDGECGVNVCLGVVKVNELSKGSATMPDIEEPRTKILEKHDYDAVSFSSGGNKVKDLNDSMDKPDILESCSRIVETHVSFDSLAENNDDSGGDNVKDLNDSIDMPNTPESCTEELDSAMENYDHCGVDHEVSGGKTVNEESKKCISWKKKGEGDDEGLVQSDELEALERRRRKTEIFVGGLDKDIEEEDIKKVFAEVGDVVGVRLLRHNTYTTGKTKGYAFVRYSSAANAKKALEKYPNVEIRGKQCRTAPVEGNDTIYLGNINKTWMTEDVVKILQEVGIERIDKVNLMSDPNNTQRNRGYAFVELETPKDAQIAFKKFQKKDVVGRLQGMKVAWAEPLDEPDEEDMLKVKCIYAEFIPSSWDELRVRDCFTKFGEIETITLSRNLRTSKRKDFAFINFKKRDDALSCVQSFKNVSQSEEDGSRVNICVSLARPLSKSSVKKKVSTPRENLKVVTTGSGTKPKETHKNDKYPPKQGVYRNIVANRNVAVNGNTGMSSRTAEAVQFLRQQDALRHSQLPQLSSGYDPIPHGVSGIKRLYTALEQNYLNSDPRGFSHPRIESSPIISSQRYSTLSQGVEMVDPYYHQQRQRVAPSVSPGYNVHPNYLERPQLQRGEPSHYGIRNWHFRN